MRIICRTGRGVKADICLPQGDFTPPGGCPQCHTGVGRTAYSIWVHPMRFKGDAQALAGAWTQLAHPAADGVEPGAGPERAYYY